VNHELRNVDRSIFYRLFAILRQNDWYYQLDDEPLLQVKDPNVAENTYAIDGRRPFVFLKEDAEVWASGVWRVREDGVPLPSGSYKVNYRDGLITFADAHSGALTVDGWAFTVLVREGYPTDEELELIELPIIAYEIESSDSQNFDIGTALKFRDRFVTVDMMARNKGEAQDLCDDLERFLAAIPVCDLNAHQPLKEDFDVDLAFSFADQYVGRVRIVGGIHSDLLRPRQGGSDKERHRALITFNAERVS
jgi:hypothetical protein